MQTPRKAIGIVRVSARNGREGESYISPEDQRKRIEDLCEREGLSLIRVEDEQDVSGGKPLEKRPGLLRSIEAIEAGEADVIAVAYYTRLARNLRVKEEVISRVEAAGGSVLAVDIGKVSEATSGQWLTGTLHMAFAEYQRREAKERFEVAKENAVDRGVWLSPKVPPGYVKGEDGRLTVDPIKAPAITQAFKMRDEGALVKDVRTFLAGHGIAYGWAAVRKLMLNPVYLGHIVYGTMLNTDAHEPLVDEATFRRVGKRVDPRGRYAKSERLLARLGVLRCGSCGSRMVVGSANSNGYVTYRCGSQDCKRRVHISAELVEQYVSSRVRMSLSELYGRASNDAQVKAAKDELEAAQDAVSAAVEAFDGIDARMVNRKLKSLQESLDAAQHAYDQITTTHASMVEIDPEADWDSLTLDEQRAILKATVERIDVAKAAEDCKGTDRITLTLYGYTPLRKGHITRLRAAGLVQSVDDAQRVLDKAAQDRV